MVLYLGLSHYGILLGALSLSRQGSILSSCLAVLLRGSLFFVTPSQHLLVVLCCAAQAKVDNRACAGHPPFQPSAPPRSAHALRHGSQSRVDTGAPGADAAHRAGEALGAP